MRPLPILVLLLFVGIVAPLAQVAAQAVEPGSLVRAREGPAAEWTQGYVVRVTPDTVWVSGAPGETPTLSPLVASASERIEVRLRRTRGQSAWRWAKRGFVSGAVVTVGSCLVNPDDCRSETPDGSSLAAGMFEVLGFLGVGGAFLGAVGGALLPGSYWVPATLPPGVIGSALTRPGAVRVPSDS